MNDAADASRQEWIAAALDRFEERLLQYAHRIVGDADEARDLVQETFLKLCREDPAELNGRLAAWLYTVCRRSAVDVLRRRSRMAPQPAEDAADWSWADRREPAPPEAAEAHDELALVRAALQQLPPRQEECVRLKFLEELSYQSISDITGLSVSNVGFLIHTGLKAVRERLRRSRVAPPSLPTTSVKEPS